MRREEIRSQIEIGPELKFSDETVQGQPSS
jgi:hypothetical protein